MGSGKKERKEKEKKMEKKEGTGDLKMPMSNRRRRA